MREILFRAKEKDGNRWCFGFPCIIREKTRIMTEDDIDYAYTDRDIYDGYMQIVNGETLCQFSGVFDSNGNRIFENDILSFDYIGENRGAKGVAPVVFENGKFGVLWGWHKELVCLDGFANTKISVIGNIFDNPELINNP